MRFPCARLHCGVFSCWSLTPAGHWARNPSSRSRQELLGLFKQGCRCLGLPCLHFMHWLFFVSFLED